MIYFVETSPGIRDGQLIEARLRILNPFSNSK